MPNLIVNYDGSIRTSPQQLVYPETVDDIQAVLRDSVRYPSPVRAMGSYHSLTPCVSSDGTILNMSRMNRVVEIDAANWTFTAQAGMQFIDASKALRARAWSRAKWTARCRFHRTGRSSMATFTPASRRPSPTAPTDMRR